jgi:hypothetical protein
MRCSERGKPVSCGVDGGADERAGVGRVDGEGMGHVSFVRAREVVQDHRAWSSSSGDAPPNDKNGCRMRLEGEVVCVRATQSVNGCACEEWGDMDGQQRPLW